MEIPKIINKCNNLSICSISENDLDGDSFELVLDKRLIHSMNDSYSPKRTSKNFDMTMSSQIMDDTLTMSFDRELSQSNDIDWVDINNKCHKQSFRPILEAIEEEDFTIPSHNTADEFQSFLDRYLDE